MQNQIAKNCLLQIYVYELLNVTFLFFIGELCGGISLDKYIKIYTSNN